MGTWSNDPFGNDIACDWVFDLIKKASGWSLRNQGFIFIKATLDKARSAGEEYLGARDADEGIAAADTVAKLRGHFYVRNAYTKSLDEWVAKQNSAIPQHIVDLALQVVDRVLTEPSELLDLWMESGDAEDWKAQLENLKERLQKPSVK